MVNVGSGCVLQVLSGIGGPTNGCADAAVSHAAGAVGNLIVDVAGGELLVASTELGFVQATVDAVLAVGQFGDYFLVKKVLRRMELTWITFPLWVVLVSAGAYALAMYTKGDDLRLNQIDLVDVDVASGSARGTSWLNVFSPQSEAFDLTVASHEPSGAAAPDAQRLLAWLGSAEGDSGAGSSSLFAGRYDFSPGLDELLHVPIQVWSTKSFLDRSSYRATRCRSPISSSGLKACPRGPMRNDLGIELSQCMLLSGSWAYLLGDLKARRDRAAETGRPARPRARAPPSGATARCLSTRRSRSGRGRDEHVAADDVLQSRPARRALTGQSNSSQEFVDLSDLLGLDRAILVGQRQCARRAAHQLRPAAGGAGGSTLDRVSLSYSP